MKTLKTVLLQGAESGSYGVMGYGNIAEPGTPAKITQNVEGIKVGDKSIRFGFLPITIQTE